MVIIETTFFTRQIRRLLSDEEYRRLQVDLVNHPEKGEIIQSSHGLRKTRWSAQGRGKRGGIRVIYYWVVKQEKILMLTAYAKNEQENLTPEQVRILRQIVESEYP
jgi:mRNA-degrading endonuclease RelE of RelBE toxin-antitoxin system